MRHSCRSLPLSSAQLLSSRSDSPPSLPPLSSPLMVDVALPPTSTPGAALLLRLSLLCCLLVSCAAQSGSDSACAPLCSEKVEVCGASCMVETGDGNMTAGACCSWGTNMEGPSDQWFHYCCVGRAAGEACEASVDDCPLLRKQWHRTLLVVILIYSSLELSFSDWLSPAHTTASAARTGGGNSQPAANGADAAAAGEDYAAGAEATPIMSTANMRHCK